MLSIAVTEPGKLEVIEVPEPEPGPYEVKVRNEVAALCNATDRKLIEGHFPGVNDYPLLLGHETAGEVVKVGEKVRSFKIGDTTIGSLLLNPTDSNYNSGWGGFSEYTIIKDHKAMAEDGVANEDHGWSAVNKIMLPVKGDITIEDAVLLCTWREVYAGLEDFDIKNNDDIKNILIFGAGPVGMSFLKLLQLEEMDFIGVVDPLENKRKLALKMGADAVYKPKEDILSSINNDIGEKLDAVVDAVGMESIINQSLSLIKMAGSVCVYGVIDKPTINIKKEDAPYNFNVLFHQWPTRDREAAAQKPLVKLIEENKINHKDFVTAEFPIEKIEEAFEASKSGENLKILLRY